MSHPERRGELSGFCIFFGFKGKPKDNHHLGSLKTDLREANNKQNGVQPLCFRVQEGPDEALVGPIHRLPSSHVRFFRHAFCGLQRGIQGELFGADRSGQGHGTKPKGSIGVLAGANGMTEPGCLGMNRGFPQLVYQQALNLY